MSNSVVNQIKIGATTYDVKPYLNSATSGDSTTATAWTSVDAIATSDSYDTVFNKVTKMVKNVRYLYNKLGTTDFSGVSSTVSGAITTLNSGKSDTTHNHDTTYAAIDHTHSNYSLTTHTHSNYSTTGHTHSEYAASDHNHDTLYATINHTHSEYSTTGHTHSNYSTTGHTHSGYSTTGHTHDYIATGNIVTSQTNSTTKVPAASLLYSMNDTLNTISSNVSTGKTTIANAITAKGVSTSSSATWATMATNIGKLKPSSAVTLYTTTTNLSFENTDLSFTTVLSSIPSNFIATCNGSGNNSGRTYVSGIGYVNGTSYTCYTTSYGAYYVNIRGNNNSTFYNKVLKFQYIDSGVYYVGGTWILVYWN